MAKGAKNVFGSKNKQPQAEVTTPTPKKAPTMLSVIAEGIEIGGELQGAGDVQLDGGFTGTIKCHALTIGQTGKMDGKVEAEQVTILGYLKGEIRSKKVRLKNSAHVVGDVYHDVLEVEAGAKIEGRYSRKMTLDTKQKPAAPVSLAAVKDNKAAAE